MKFVVPIALSVLATLLAVVVTMVVYLLVGPDGTAMTRQPSSQSAGTQLTA